MGYNFTFEKLFEVLRRAIKAATKVATVGPLVGYLPAVPGGPPPDRYPDIWTVDGTILSPGDRVLVKNQPGGFQLENGIFEYVVDLALIPEGTIPQPGAGLIRSREADEIEEIFPGALIPVQLGTSKDVIYILQHSGVDQPIPGVDVLVFKSTALGGALSAVLAAGNQTLGNDIEVSLGDALRFEEGGGGVDGVQLKGPLAAMGASYDIRFPNLQGAGGTVLQNDGAGNMSWGTVPVVSTTWNAGEVIGTGMPVVAEWNPAPPEVRVFRADADHGTLGRRRVMGIALNGAGVGAPVTVHLGHGQIVPVLFAAAPLSTDNGKTIYLSATAGSVQVVPPPGPGLNIFQIGTVVGANGVSTTVNVVFEPQLIAAL
jgi:hypothetical protein